MHMADALLSPPVAATMYAATAVVTGVSIHQLKKEDAPQKLPLMAVSAALVFAGQMVNYAIPGTGSSGHLCGGFLLSALLGPYAGFLSMVVILAIQCLLFADGGLMALGANIWNMAFYGCFFGYFLLWRPIVKSRIGGEGGRRLRILLASLLSCTLSLLLGAFSVVLETSLSGITELPFVPFLGLMLPIHLAIGAIEGLISAAILCFVDMARPELLTEIQVPENRRGSAVPVVAILAAITLMVGGGLSLLASSHPDGLEWSLFGNAEEGYSQNMALDEEDYGVKSALAESAGAIQEGTSLMKDYALPGREDSLSTSAAGILGSILVAVFAFLICILGGFFRRRTKTSRVPAATDDKTIGK